MKTSKEKEVFGIVISKQGSVTAKTFPFALRRICPTVLVSKKDDIRSDIETILGAHLLSYYNQKTLTEISEATGRVGQIRNLSYLFSFIFILFFLFHEFFDFSFFPVFT